MKFNVIAYDPCDRVSLPKPKRFVGSIYTIEQSKQLIQALEGEAIKPAVMLGLFLGLRRSEVLGLRWKDIDFDENVVKIRNTVVEMITRTEAEQTKSKAGRRDLSLMPVLKTYLLQLKKEQDERKALIGNAYYDSDRICVWEDGTPFKPGYISQRFPKLLEENNLPRIRFHDLRHTVGSILLRQGRNIKQVQEYLGHDDVSTTLNIYVHTLQRKKKRSRQMC